jgi:hypothetical protein
VIRRRTSEVTGFWNSSGRVVGFPARLGGLRDTLAYGGLLHAEPDPLHAVELFEDAGRSPRVWKFGREVDRGEHNLKTHLRRLWRSVLLA